MATIPGHITDEVIVLGNHRDAWILGGSDPNSGTASQYELIRGLGKLLSKGWKPLRSIVLCSWDAEEYGLIGSTEWAEDFGSWLWEYSAAYLNLDSSVSGSNFGGAASPSLAWLTRTAAEQINTGADEARTIWSSSEDAGNWQEWRAQMNPAAAAVEAESVVADHGIGISTLGSGSDFTAFLQRYGVASGNIGYHGGPKDPVYHYHSIYDSFTWQDKFADPGFHKHVDAAKVLGLMLLRLADSLVLPINTTQYSLELTDYLAKVQSIASTSELEGDVDLAPLGSSIKDLVSSSYALDEQKAAALAKLRELLPKRKHHKHGLFGKLAHAWRGTKGDCQGNGLENADIWGEEEDAEYAGEVGAALPHLPHPKAPHAPHMPHPPKMPHLPGPKDLKEIKAVLKEIRGINKKLQGFEKGFISEEGITDREWYKHKGVAPGKWLGYGATTFPALTEAFTIEKDLKLAQKEADELTEMIAGMAKRLSA